MNPSLLARQALATRARASVVADPTRPGNVMQAFIRRLSLTIVLLFALIAAGTVGYMSVEGWPLMDSLFMTAITLSAVGYREVRPLSEAGRAFSLFVILGGLTWMRFWFANLTSLIVELDLKDVLRRRRTMREIARMKVTSSCAALGGRAGRLPKSSRR